MNYVPDYLHVSPVDWALWNNLMLPSFPIVQAFIYFTCCDDDYGAEEPDFRVREPELVHALCQPKHRVHQELGVAGWHVVDAFLPDEIPVQAHHTMLKERTKLFSGFI